MVSKILVLSTLFSLALAKPTARDMKVREARESVPSGYVRTGAAPADTELQLRISLVQNNPNGLIDALYDVSTPGSASYGEHLSKEEYARTTKKKRADTRKGKQHSAQPRDVAHKTAAYRETGHAGHSRAALYEQAKANNIPGRSKMNKDQLAAALGA